MREMSRSASVSLAHRYWNFDWSASRNRATYGEFASPEGIGSNLRIELAGDAEPDLELGLREAKDLIDHRALFTDLAHFARHPSTLECITDYLDRHLREVAGRRLRRLTVFEDEHRWCTVETTGDERRLSVSERVFNLVLTWRGSIDATSGLLAPRARAEPVVRRIAPAFAEPFAGDPQEWARAFYAALRNELPRLHGLRIDLGRDRNLTVIDDDQGDSPL